MVATWQRAAPTNYYKAQTAYYLGGVERQGRWYAPGGDFALKDGAEVDLETFERLYAGIGPDGRSLISNRNGRGADRVGAYDMTLSAPRSVSLVLVWAPPETRQALEDAHDRAVRAALQMIEREACYARRGHGGERIEKVALIAAVFTHGESRPAKHINGKIFADMNSHHHAVCLSLATRADGTVGALHSIPLRDAKLLAGSVYHAALASELQALGFAIDRVGYNGVFEICGVDDDLINYFSARRNEIDHELEKHGVTSKDAAALASAIAKSTRTGKNADASLRREQIWAEAAIARGVDVEKFSDNLRRSDRSLDVEAAEKLFEERLTDLPRALTEDQSVVERKELLRAVATALVGTGLPVSRIDPAVERFLETQAIIEIGRDNLGRPRYSTPEMVRIERETVASATRLASAGGYGLDAEHTHRLCENARLSNEQTLAALGASAPGRLVVIAGAAGSGKSTTLRPIVEGYKAAGHRVLGAASAWRVANALQGELAISSRAIASWAEKLSHGGEFLARGDVLIVDEAGLVAAREMHALLTHAEQVGAKILLVGDPRQLAAIGPDGLGLVTHALDALRVDTILRQRDPWAREAVRAFSEGRASAALDAFAAQGKIDEAEGAKAAIDKIVEAWRESLNSDTKGPLLLARTNAAVAAISRAVRKVLREEGSLTGRDVEIRTVTPSGQPTSISLAQGDRIRFLVRHDGLGVINGATARVLAVRQALPEDSRSAGAVRIEAEVDGRRVEFSPEDIGDHKGRAKLGWAYASTIYQSQGSTVDKAVVLVDAGFDRRQIYVAASRARQDTLLVVDGKAIDGRLAADLPPDQQHRDQPFSPEERRTWLATRLSHARTRESTLDVLVAGRPVEPRRDQGTVQTRKVDETRAKRGRGKSRGLTLD